MKIMKIFEFMFQKNENQQKSKDFNENQEHHEFSIIQYENYKKQ